MAAVKTSVSIRESTLAAMRAEARRQKRSVSFLMNSWAEETLAEIRKARRNGHKSK